jgi:hypothetical protein
MAEGWQWDDFEDLLAEDLRAVSHDESPGSRRLLDGASVAMGDESAQGGLGVLASAAAAGVRCDIFRRYSRRLCDLVAKMNGGIRSMYDARKADHFIGILYVARSHHLRGNEGLADVLRNVLRDFICESKLSASDRVELFQAVLGYSSATSSSICAACADLAAGVRDFDELLCFCAGSCPCVRGSAEDAASAAVLTAAPVPSQLERYALSPKVDLSRDERTEVSLTVDGGALASGISGPLSEEAAVSVAGASDSVKEAPVPKVDPYHGERTEFSPGVEQEREQGCEQEQERLGEQSIGMASDIAVDRLDAISSVGGASREAVVVLKIGRCPGLGGRAVVSVSQAVGAGFGCLAGGMPVIRADAAGLGQEAIVRVADERELVKEVPFEPMVVVDAAHYMMVKISERCEAVPACVESMGLLVEVVQMVLSPAVSGKVVDQYMGALALLANMAVKIIVSGSDPPKMGCLVHSGFDPPMLRCC